MTRWSFGRARKGGQCSFDRCYAGGQFLPFYVPRPIMPQINEEDYPELFSFLSSLPLLFDHHYKHPDELRPHQRIDRFKAGRMTPQVRQKPILISNDGYVLDGNHRWLAHKMEGTLVPCWQIDQGFELAIDTLFAFPKTFSLNVHPETN